MSEFSAKDRAHMQRALELAAFGEFTAHPNPMVGCVLVRDGEVIGEGWHRMTGDAHAEINAIADAGDARGATAYVSLEPCSHAGRTGPCTSALIDAGVAEVVVATEDPFDGAAGRGVAMLESAGVTVRCGLLADDARQLNRGFFSRVVGGRPYVRLKIAASIDGATAMASGESQWITGKEARADVQRLRARSGAILTGIGTVVSDDPSLNVRDPAIDTDGRQPHRVVLDTGLRMPVSAGMLCLPGETLVYCVRDKARSALVDAGATVVRVDEANGHVDAVAVLADLARREINDVLVEAGPRIAGSLLDAGLVDELVIYLAPHIMGSVTRRMFETPGWNALGDRRAIRVTDVAKVGGDMRITAVLDANPGE